MACTNPVYLKEQEIIVPCGKCFYCRRKYILMWTLRLSHELISYKNKAISLTLTYNDDNLPPDRSVSVRDIQLFIKRLRKHFKDLKLKYYCCSEYGAKERTFRPHYHLIIYGLNVRDRKDEQFKFANLISEKIWKKGFVRVKPVHSNTISYTVKYLLKGILYDNSKLDEKGYKPNFSLKSKGLGLDYLIENWSKYVYADYITFKKYKLGVPRFYRDKLIELGYMHPEYPTYKHKVYLDNLVKDIFVILRKQYGDKYTNPYKTIKSYFTGLERDFNWFRNISNPDIDYYHIDGNHKQHFFYHYLLYVRNQARIDEIEFFSDFTPRKKIHRRGVYYGNT